MVSSFFVARIVLGVKFAIEFWGACLAEMRAPLPLLSSSSLGPISISSLGEEGKNIPALALALCLLANVAMNSLNFYWFSKMLSGAVKHLLPSKKKTTGGATAGASAAEAAAATTTTTTTTATMSPVSSGAAVSSQKAAATATATDTLNRRVFSVRSTSSGLEASEGKAAAAAAAAAPLTPERRAATAAR
jgi:hypothetical protein